MYLVRTAGWMIAGIYATIPSFWMIVHPFADRWRSKGYSIKWLGVWWVLLWLLAWLVEYPFRNDVLYQLPWTWLISAGLWSISIRAYSSSAQAFSLDRIIGRHEIDDRREQKLITTGIYARVRNPLYAAHLCTILGWAVGTGLSVVYACAIVYVATLMLMLPREEQELRGRFGAEYDDYCKRVPRLIPKLF